MSRFSRTKRTVWTFDEEQADARLRRKRDFLATEEPLEIQLNAGGEQRTVAITMRTPGNDYELAAGFLFNEGIIHSKHDLHQMTYCMGDERDLQEYNMLDVRLRFDSLPNLPHLERHFFTNSACGICGTTMLDDLAAREVTPVADGPTVSPALLSKLPALLRDEQRLFDSTGGLHAAALFDTEGTLLALREDVGRHNALDKLIGWGVINQQLPFQNRIILVSGRASYELLQKCLAAGSSILCAVSAPSSLAVELAERFNITLVGFLRHGRFNVYSGVHRIAQRPAR